jgi:hypothetical protein
MNTSVTIRRGRLAVALTLAVSALVLAPLAAQIVKVDLSKETVGKRPVSFEPGVGTWVVAQDGPDKVIKVDGTPWKAAQDNPTKLLVETARKLYGTSNEELMDNAKQFAHYPVAVLKSLNNFTNGTISVKFKTIAGDLDRASGILFNVKPNGDWLSVRYNDTEHNVALWTFHGDGIRRNVKFSDRANEAKFTVDKPGPDGKVVRTWHELKMTVNGADFKAWLDDMLALEYTFGTDPVAGRRGPPNEFLFPKNNPTLTPPIAGKVGLWSKTDSTSEFKDFVIW